MREEIHMTAKQIFSKTMKFCWMKLGLGLVNVIIAIVLFAILTGIGLLFDNGGFALILILIWLGLVKLTNFIIMHYFGYLLKAGHIAVITTAVTTGQVPDNQVEVGTQMVKERFLTANIYFGVDKLISGAVRQLQGMVDKASSFLSFIPGMDMIAGFGKFFLNISLGYIDECCLGYTFFQKEQGAAKSAADGVVIYAQNWKLLLKNAAKTSLIVILTVVGMTVASFVVIGGLFRILNWNIFVAVIISFLVARVIKYAFIDSWILVKTMSVYMEVAPSTQITFDLYGKLCNLSRSFRKLFEQGQSEQPASYAAAGAAPAASPNMGNTAPAMQPQNAGTMPSMGQPQSARPVNPVPQPQVSQAVVFCGNCGSQNAAGTKFCGSCGSPM